jgi:6-phosphogluconolactonase/glucosamine-6-phosphate isomerase/deaminase
LEPHNLGGGWVGFDYQRAFGKPVKIINDAAMQALGRYKKGKMLFLGLGTGLGTCMVVDGIVEPIELGHLPYKKATYEDYVGIRALETARQYASTLERLAGSPSVLDLAHLGVGPDGHTALLVPGDPVLTVMNTDVALTGVYMGRRRMTLTYPILNRSRRILFLVTGKEKVEMLPKLLAADNSIPSGRIRQDSTVILADRNAADRAAAS